MSRRTLSAGLGVLVGLLPLLAGCKDAPAVSSVRWELERQIPGAEFEREFRVRLGRMSLGLVKGLAGWALDDEEGSTLLRAVKRVDVGAYRVVSLPPLESVEAPGSLESKLGGTGWTMLLREQSPDEHVWVYTRLDDEGAIRNVYVVALDDVELTLVSLEGRLDETLMELIADDPGGFAGGLAG